MHSKSCCVGYFSNMKLQVHNFSIFCFGCCFQASVHILFLSLLPGFPFRAPVCSPHPDHHPCSRTSSTLLSPTLAPSLSLSFFFHSLSPPLLITILDLGLSSTKVVCDCLRDSPVYIACIVLVMYTAYSIHYTKVYTGKQILRSSFVGWSRGDDTPMLFCKLDAFEIAELANQRLVVTN